MPQKPLESLGALVRERRGPRKLREVAADIGIGAATLLRVESGRIPDVATFGRLCKWLGIAPGTFLGIEEKPQAAPRARNENPNVLSVSAHLRADQTPKRETIEALAQMLALAANIHDEEP